MKASRMFAVPVVLALLAGACGGGSGKDTPAATRTVAIAMRDIEFEPGKLEAKRGETVRFKFTNTGAVTHDAFIGDSAAQADHERDMRADDKSDGDHGEGHDSDSEAITVKPGKTGTLTYTFDKKGGVQIGCHQPGHYAAGMKIDVTVS